MNFQRIRRSLLLLSVALFPLDAAWGAQGGTRWAILIGINDYIGAQDLKYCCADQKALFDQLASNGFDSERMFMICDDAKDKKYLPFKSNIEKQLELITGLTEPGDMLVLAFSGHGVHIAGKSYLCPTDADFKDVSTLIPMESIYNRLKTCKAPLKLILVDACRNNPQLEGQRSFAATRGSAEFAETLKDAPLPEGVVVINSCAPGETSWERQELGHGVFMNFLLEGLRGQADEDRDGSLTVSEISQYAFSHTRLYVAKTFNDSQRPFLSGELSIEALGFEIGRGTPRESSDESAAAAVLTDSWSGIFYYPPDEGQAPVRFEAFLLHNPAASKVEGRMKEPRTFGTGTDPWLHATLEGSFDPNTRKFTFTKQYDGSNAVDHAVLYEGVLSADGKTVNGTWRIPNDWGGKFVLTRK